MSERETLAVLARKVAIVPEGAGDALLPLPAEVEVSDGDLDKAAALWDEWASEAEPELVGLLVSDVVEGDA